MARVVYVPELGRSFSFRDTASDQEISAYLEGNFNSPAPAEKAAAPDETKEPESDESGILGRFGVGLVRSLTDLPGGLSAVMYPAKQAEATPFGQFTKFAAETSEGIAGIDRTKQPTTAQETAEMVGGLAGLFIPGTAAAKAGTVAKLGPAAIRRIAGSTAATQGALLNAEQRAETIRQQLDAGMQISPEKQLRAQRLDAIVGLSEALPIERFWRPISTILSKVPASKIGMVEKILESRLGNIAKAATGEGLQEVGANVASDLVELNVYNPNVEVGQDILSNAAMGAFGGSLVEALVQVAAGRKMRGYRQLQADLRTEEGQNLADYRRGSVANAAERLRQFNVEGPVEISQEEIDNVPTFTIRTKGGNVLGSLPDIDSANQAIELYRKNTGADIQVVEPPKPIDVFPVKIGKKKFDSLDAVRTERDNLISRIQAAKVLATDPIRIKEGASKIGVSEPLYQKKAKANLDKLVREVEPLEAFVFDAQPTPPSEPVGDELDPDRIKALRGLSPIPFERPVYDEATKSKSRQSGQSPVVDYGGRKIVIKDVNGVKVPFYLSSGLAGKKNVAAGKWYPFFGIGGDGWINKGSQDQINNFYDSDELRAAAEELDGTIGDIRNDDSVPKVGLSGSHIDAINDGLSPSSNGEPDTGIRVSENIQSIINRIRSPQTTVEAVSAVEPSQPIGVSEPAPEAPEAGISAIPEADVGARPFEEPLASKTGPTPVPTEEDTGGQMAAGRLPGTFVRPKTVAEAEAVVTAPREYTPERKAYNDKLYNELSSRLQNIATPEIKLELRSMIDTAPGFLVRGHVTSKGTPNGVEVLVEISRDIIDPSKPIDDNVNALLDVLNHEIIHVVRRQLRPIEWQVLSKAVANTNVPGKKYTYLDKAEAVYMRDGVPMTPEYADPEAVIEEAVAEMYKDWVRNKRAPAQTRGPFNRITEFFRSIFRALKSNAQEGVFKSIESGEVGKREAAPVEIGGRFSAAPLPSKDDWATSGSPPPGKSSLDKNGSSPFRISQRRPTSVGNIGQSVRENLLVNVAAMRKDIDQLLHNIDIVKSYPGFPVVARETPEDTLKRFKKHIVGNLLWLHDTMDPEVRLRAKLWYDGARMITNRLSKEYNLPDTTVAAVVAGLSPQKDWFQNVSLAERLIDIVAAKGNFKFNSEMMRHARKTASIKKYKLVLDMMEGKTLNQISTMNVGKMIADARLKTLSRRYTSKQIRDLERGANTLAKAIFVRVYDEVYNPRTYNILTPEGDRGLIAKTKKGKPSKVAWGSFTEIGKGVSAIEDGSKESVDEILGDKHKIRNFYNNIISPNSSDGSVTIDTHAVAAGHLRPLSGSSIEVHHNFGTSPKGARASKNSSITGIQGLYAIYADAYRDAAKQRGILPREMQSITWEAVRGLYKPTFKAQDKNVKAVQDVWTQYKKGKISVDKVRNQILTIADPGAVGINSPFWKDTPGSRIYGTGRDAVDAGKLGADGVRKAAGRTDGGRTSGDAGRTAGVRFSAAPLPAYVEAKNETLFAKHDRVPFFKMVSDFLFNPNVGNRLINVQGYTEPVTLSKWTQAGLAARVAVTDKNAAVTYLEKLLNQKISGNFSRMVADFSATAALAWRNRSSHLTAAMIRMGKLDVDFARPGDIQSATLKVSEDPDSLMNVVKVLMEPGATDPNTGITKDKRDVYKSYAVAMRSKNKKAAGLSVPGEVDDNYINIVIPFTEQNYPEVVEAYKMYQRFNKKLLESAVKAGLIKQSELNNLTRDMDYYGFYHEVYDTAMVPGMSTKTASEFKLRPYRGSEFGNLVNDPVFMMIHNAQFWVDSIAKNLATTKAFEVTRLMNESRLLGTGEDPKEEEGEQRQVMFFKKDGVLKRFAVKDPLLVTALGSDDRIDMGRFFKMMGLPTHILRESVTRDPGFMIANLLRDTLSSWITSGEDITPFLGTLNGAKKALKKETSFTALMGRGVVGSYDLAMLDPADLAAKISQIAKPRNVHTIPNLEAGINVVGSLWGRLGTLSEASDAATRIAVYDSAIKQGMSEAEASFRAIELMDFSRRGASSLLGVMTKLIPFLNARIQGLDVLYQAGRSGLRVLGGRTLGERDANLGKKFLVRGGMLAALSMFLEWANDGDDDYEQLDDYVKNGNLLIPLTMFGLEKQFLAIPKPFEAGLIFSTVPQQFYKSMSGEASTRENVQLFTAQLAGTFGVNPIPQALVPLAEVWWNVDMYTGLPLISEGKSRLAPELQYNSSTSTLSMMLGKIPISYNLTSGRFEGVSPIIIENLIEGYTGPVGSMIVDMVGIGMDAVDAGPERLPIDFTKLPVVRRVFVDAEKKNPKAVTQAYELFQLVDEVNRSLSRLKQMGDVEAVKDYVEQNRDVLTYRKYIFKMVDGLNKLNARERQIERDTSMTPDEKREAIRKLREFRINLTSKVSEINAALGR